jgi:endonuclease/exonuclease/phosphatase family metal-dependent hydrolase
MKIGFLVALLLCTGCARPPDRPAGPAPAPVCRQTPPGAEPVRWLLPRGDADDLDPWCAAVAEPLVRGMAPGDSSPGAVDSLLVVTWNVHVGGGDLLGFTRRLQRGELTGGGPVRHFVILLQEAFRSGVLPDAGPLGRAALRLAPDPPHGERLDVAAAARVLGLSVVYVPSMRNGLPGQEDEVLNGGVLAEDRGNAILSTLPLHQPVALELPAVRQRRVAVAAVVRGRTRTGVAWELQVASAHLENRGGRDILGLHGRALQAAWLASALPPAHLAVLGGDLNTWVRGAGEAALDRLLPHFPSTPPVQPPGPTHVSHIIMRGRLDYIFARLPGGRMVDYDRVPDLHGSDHYPLLAWVHLPLE